MTIVYDKLIALDVPPSEQSYGPKDCILYALGLGFGQDPMSEDELAFVYEKNLKVLPTMGTVLGHPGFWARNYDTGIDWLRQRRTRHHAAPAIDGERHGGRPPAHRRSDR
jgi:hypothetical protein